MKGLLIQIYNYETDPLSIKLMMAKFLFHDCSPPHSLRSAYRGNGPIRNREFLIWAKGKGDLGPSKSAIFKKHCGFIKDFSRELPKANYILCKNRLFLRNPRKAKCLGPVSYWPITPVHVVTRHIHKQARSRRHEAPKARTCP